MKRFSKKTWVVIAVVAVAAIAAIGGYAYWTTSGSGTGSATTGTNSAVTITQTSTVSGLTPGSDAQALDFKITNPASTNQYVSSVVISISSVTAPNADATHPCAASDFTLVQPSAINSDLAPGDTAFSPSGASIALNNSSSNQDGCKGATANLSYSAS